MAEQQVPAIVQEWTLRTEQAQANARALGEQVDRSAKQGTAAAAGLDAAMGRTAASTDRAAKASLSLGRQMRVATVAVSLVGSAMRIASSSSEDLAQNIGSAARETGIMIALMAPGPFKIAGIALLAAGGFMELLGKKSSGAARDVAAVTESLHKINDAIRATQQLGREPTDIEIEVDVNRRELEQLEDSIAGVMFRIDREQQKGIAGRLRARGLAVDLVNLEEKQADARRLGIALDKERQSAEIIATSKRAKSQEDANADLARESEFLDRILAGEDERSAALAIQSDLVLGRISANDALIAQGGVLAKFAEKENEALRESLRLARQIAGKEGDADEKAAFERKVEGFANAFSANLSGTFSDSVVDGLFEGFANADQIVIDFAKRSTKIMADALFEKLLGDATRNVAASIFEGIFDSGVEVTSAVAAATAREASAAALALAFAQEPVFAAEAALIRGASSASSVVGGIGAAQFGGTFVGKDSIVRVAEREPEVVLRARDLRAIERSFSTGGSSAVVVPHVVIDAERTVGQGVSRALVRGIRPAIRRPRNVAEARIERR